EKPMRKIHCVKLAAAVALTIASPAFPQQSGQPGSQASQQPADKTTTPAAKPASAKQPEKKPKKIWTNDDIPSAPDPNLVDPATANARPEPTVGPVDKKEVVANFRKQLNKLRGDLSATEKKISDLQNFKANNTSPSGGIDPHHGYTMTPIPDQIRQLEEKK